MHLFSLSFFLSGLKFHVDLLEYSHLKSDGRTVRTTVRRPLHMNTEGTSVTVGTKKTRNNPCLI